MAASKPISLVMMIKIKRMYIINDVWHVHLLKLEIIDKNTKSGKHLVWEQTFKRKQIGKIYILFEGQTSRVLKRSLFN